MKVITWVLRILSTITFIAMCYLVYTILQGYWDWDAPYIFIVTVFRLISMVLFFLASVVFSAFAGMLVIGSSEQIFVGLYNSLILRLWYMQPYGVQDPYTSVEQVFFSFTTNIFDIGTLLWESTFTFLYFLFAAIGVALFLQSLFREEHKFVGGAFLSIQAILIVAAFNTTLVPTFAEFPNDFVLFFLSNVQILALVSFAYLEISYQMLYSVSVGKPVEDREETFKKQLLALRQATRKQDTIERGEKIGASSMSRSTSATAFSFLREAMERKIVGNQEVLENLDAISDVRRLQIFTDELMESDPQAREELTARAAAPSESYVVISTLTGSALRFLGVLTISFVFMNTQFFVSFFNLPPGVSSSLDILQPEVIIFFMLPIILLFPLIAMILSWTVSRSVEEKPSKDEKKRRKERAKKRKEAAKIRKKREEEIKKVASGDTKDEWDKALEDTYSRRE